MKKKCKRLKIRIKYVRYRDIVASSKTVFFRVYFVWNNFVSNKNVFVLNFNSYSNYAKIWLLKLNFKRCIILVVSVLLCIVFLSLLSLETFVFASASVLLLKNFWLSYIIWQVCFYKYEILHLLIFYQILQDSLDRVQ